MDRDKGLSRAPRAGQGPDPFHHRDRLQQERQAPRSSPRRVALREKKVVAELPAPPRVFRGKGRECAPFDLLTAASYSSSSTTGGFMNEIPVLSFPRKPTRAVRAGSLTIGGGAPISVQSMTATKTRDVDATVG